MTKPRILILDIETAPIEAFVWGLFDQNIGLDMVKSDWSILSIAAKWLDEKKIFYLDQRKSKKVGNDKPLLEMIWKLLDEADLVVTQNGKSFDIKKINARFLHNKMKPPSSFRQIDTKILAKKHFGFTSNKLEYMSKSFNDKYTKLKHKKFPGFDLWSECLKGNLEAWKEMEKYNKYDVLATEELYSKLRAWDNSINFSIYSDKAGLICQCGSTDFSSNGFRYTNAAKYRRYNCKSCGASHNSKFKENSSIKTKKK